MDTHADCPIARTCFESGHLVSRNFRVIGFASLVILPRIVASVSAIMTKSSGYNSQGNHYNTPGGTNSSSGSSYHYSNSNGSYYYSNDNGSTYYNSGKGSATYTSSSGQSRSYSTSK
ncbi:hypothetical protein HJC23_007190 [Cyclotella cryptica]|uniref:Uncharacterized protein n=1 Tax=Cyclotella cryptica TaxID=29204 RepID=A0ABD3QWB7_9STRA|eukprot:CCRYP_003465-RE/>CCRYP_003465-RE protein AED:0.46 eAED:0.46 QI:223/1/1/1/1/1/2/410/116